MKKTRLPETRLNSLYSDFRPLKELNPEGFHANVRTWKDYLLRTVCHDRLTIKCGRSLLESLNLMQFGVPQSIDVVLDELVSEGTLIPLEDFVQGKQNIFLSSLRWALRKTPILPPFRSRISSKGFYLKEVELVAVPSLEEKYGIVMDKIKSSIYSHSNKFSDLIFTKDDFCRRVQMNDFLNDWAEFEIMLTYLQLFKREIVVDNNVVKMCGRGAGNLVSNFEPNKITENDRSIASLKSVTWRYKSQISNLEESIAHYSQVLEGDIESGCPKELQRVHLRIKKMLEKNLLNSYNNLHNIQQMRDSIEAALDAVTLYEVLQQSKGAIKTISEELGSVEKIEKTLIESEDEMSKIEEISNVLTAGRDNEDEIDKELENMGKELKKEQEALNKLSKLQIGKDEVGKSTEEADDIIDSKSESQAVPLAG